MLEKHLLESYHTFAAQISDKQVWIACSGGRDSMVLAHLVHQLYLTNKLPFKPRLIHVNHGMQQANDDWALLVKNWADEHAMPCQIVKAELTGNNEQAARQGRYAAIMHTINDGDVLLLAHHANDQAETMLMRLFQGAGVTGLSAMRAWTKKQQQTSAHTKQSKSMYLWRPLLSASRQQITEYAEAQQLIYVDDPTNITGDNIRSQFRRELLPNIEQIYPQAVQSISRSSQLLADATDILSEVFAADLQRCRLTAESIDECCEVLDIDQVCQLSTARQSQLIHRWVQGNEAVPPSHQRVQEILALIQRSDNDQQSQLNWQGRQHGYSIRRYRNQLFRLQQAWLAKLDDNSILSESSSLLNESSTHTLYVAFYVVLASVFAKESLASMSMRKLTKKDKISLAVGGYRKSGKSLLQSLAIPSWERASIQLVVFQEETIKQALNGAVDKQADEQIIAIISPRSLWLLPIQTAAYSRKVTKRVSLGSVVN